MNSNNMIFRRDEEYIYKLRRLYESYGYKKFKMGKFEKYDLYLENKSFLRNANIITVTDPAGRLLALKPDITLSIVKNIRAAELPEKVYYNENIYLPDSSSGEIKETTQVGLEYIGDLDVRALAELLVLASESLANTGKDYRIAISHLGFVSEIIDSASVSETEKEHISELISDKNLHGLKDLCTRLELSDIVTDRLCALIRVCGELFSSIENAKMFAYNDASKSSLDELSALANIISSFGLADKFILDFSVMNDMNDMNYYNGLVFQGFINGVPKTVLSGGRYDNLVRRFGCKTSAAGFAVYTDLLSRFHYDESEYDYEVFLQYSEDCDPISILKMQKDFSDNGKTCIALTSEPEKLKYKTKVTMLSDGSVKYE